MRAFWDVVFLYQGNVDFAAVFFDETESDAGQGMLHGHALQFVIVVLEKDALVDFVDFDVEFCFEFNASEKGLECAFAASWSVDFHAFAEFHGGDGQQESWQAEDVVSVPVGDEYFGDFGEADACYFHLALGSFPAVEENAV